MLKICNKPSRKLVDSLLPAASDTCSTGWIWETKREYRTRKEARATDRLQNKTQTGSRNKMCKVETCLLVITLSMITSAITSKCFPGG